MESFGPVAPFYDELMSQVPYEMWVSYYQLLLAHADSRPKSLLDVCCGTGNLAALLSRQGYSVTGVDLSEPMIEVARSKAVEAGDDIQYFTADVASMSLGRVFDGAFSFFDSLNYITDPLQLRAAVNSVGAHVVPGGTFVFDVNTEYAFTHRMFDQQDQRKKSKLKYKWRGNYDPVTRLIRVSMDFWHDGGEFHEEHVQRAHTHDELCQYLAEAGFEVAFVFDSYSLDLPKATSDRLHYVAIKSSG